MSNSGKRKLAVVLFADIAGYSAMMQQDESQARQCIQKFKNTLQQNETSHQGKIIQYYGDGCVAIFDSPVDAVRFAIEVQTIFGQAPAVPVRIGIHSGDVYFEENNVYGDSVNVASRVESLGQPGTILISDRVERDLRNHPEFKRVSLGNFEFKNITVPVEVYALANEGLIIPRKEELKGKLKEPTASRQKFLLPLLSGGALIAVLAILYFFIKPSSTLSGTAANTQLTSVAVLPFKVQAGSDVAYLSEGFMDLLSTRIDALEGIAAIDPTISNSIYQKNNRQIDQALKAADWAQLNATYLISGSIVQLGNSYQLLGTLTERGGKVLSKVEERCHNLDSLYNSVDAFTLRLLSSIYENREQSFTSFVLHTTDNFSALNEFMKGEQARRQGSFQQSHYHYQKALQLDSTFALAWLRLWNNIGYYDPDPDGPQSEIIAKRNLNRYKNKLSPQLSDYLEALNLVSTGAVQASIQTLQASLKRYGPNVDVLFELGDIIYHNNFIFGKSKDESIPYFEQVLQYDDHYYEAEQHLLELKMGQGDTAFIKQLTQKYKGKDPYNYMLTVANHYVDGLIDSTYTDSLFRILQADPAPYYFMKIGEYDRFLEIFASKWNFYQQNIPQFEGLETAVLISQGKFREAFLKYPNRLKSSWFALAYILSEKNFQFLDQATLDELLSYLRSSGAYNGREHSWHNAALSVLLLAAGEEKAYRENLRYLQEQARQSTGRRAQATYHYLINRLRLTEYRLRGDNEATLTYIDSVFSQLVHFENLGAYSVFYTGLKFVEAELRLEMNQLDEARAIFESLETSGFELYLYGPIQFRLGFIDELQGKKPESYHRYQYFVAIYGDCDPFYQPNVQYAKDRINAYEAGLN